MSGPVRQVRAEAYRMPTSAPEADGTLAWDSTTIVVVHVRTDDHEGLGYTYTDASAASLVNRKLADVVVAGDADDVVATNAAMRRALRNIGDHGLGAAALSAVDVALWDLQARAKGVPLADLVGRQRESVPVYGSGGFTTLDGDGLADQLTGWVTDLGVGAVKMKIGESWGSAVGRDLERVTTARAAIGADVALFVDANGGYDREQALEVGRALEERDVRWFEEPVSSDDVEGLRLLRAALRCDVSAGEYTWRLQDAARLLDGAAVDCLQLDVTRCGGITGWVQAAALAHWRGVELSTHCAPQVSAHVGCATVGVRHLEWFHDHVRLESELFDGALRPAAGVVAPDPDRPGLGLSVRAEVAGALRVQP
ncbi:MAG: mandelate racemase [Frankiales bacterium]|nr:mandelate racemase [Frankiales bacterium]